MSTLNCIVVYVQRKEITLNKKYHVWVKLYNAHVYMQVYVT